MLKFAEALDPALPLEDSAAALEKYDDMYKSYYDEGMRRYGCCAIDQGGERPKLNWITTDGDDVWARYRTKTQRQKRPIWIDRV